MVFFNFFTIILGMTGFNKLVGVKYLAGNGGSRARPPLFFDQIFLRPPPFPLISVPDDPPPSSEGLDSPMGGSQ